MTAFDEWVESMSVDECADVIEGEWGPARAGFAAGQENIKRQVIQMIQQCVDRDATLAKLADAVREL